MATRRPSRAVQIGAALAAFGLLAGLLVSVFVGVGTSTPEPTTTSSAPTTTTAPLSAEEYQQRVQLASLRTTEAAGDRCALAVAYTDVQSLPAPSDAVQMQALVEVTVELLKASAASATTDQPEVAEQLTSTADELAAEAEAAGYEPGFLADTTEDSALADPAFNDAFTRYQELTFETCFAETPSVEGEAPG